MDYNLQKYVAFVKTAECESFTEAARLLHYSQSGISRRGIRWRDANGSP